MITLNQDQQQAKTDIINFLAGPDKCFVLTGSAGTGKTATISQVMQEINRYELQQAINNNADLTCTPWYITATTNKAKQALQLGMPNKNIHTIHSLLTLGIYKGNLVSRGEAKVAPTQGIVVIDECSYVDYKLLDYINSKLHDQIKIIYVGDKNQLTPVKLDHTPVFNNGFPIAELTTPVRQQSAPLIAAYCEQLKQYIQTNDSKLDIPSYVVSSEIVSLTDEEFKAKVDDVFIYNKGSTLHNRVLAYDNSTVINHNTHLFALAKGRTELVPGDVVNNNSYVKNIKTDEEVIIIQKANYTSSIANCDGTIFTVQGLTVQADLYVPDNPKVALATIEQVIETDLAVYPQVGALKNEANKLFEMFADLRPLYASTVHKAQGSTFENVYIDLNSFRHCRDKIQKARLLYVAFSRASKQVFLTGDV